ncbi:MAG: transporter [Gloeocapsa sp. DLM2.Bin57]|nr:MAG: transporter [Gloeocapsa sp. DLM2.Bin57]
MINNLPAVISIVTFMIVIGVIIFDKLHLTIAGLLGALILVFTHVMTLQEAVEYISFSYATLALFFGVMVLIRAFEPTKIFEYLATQIILFAKGSGKLLLIGIVLVTTVVCSVLPNATTVMLLAPVIPPLAQDLGINFVPLLILMVLVSNSAGLLTLVGDPATFIVGHSINLSFLEYMQRLSLGGILAVIVICLMLPILFKKMWRTKYRHLEDLPHPQINHPRVLAMGGVIMLFVLVFFVIGESFVVPISPAAVALMGATLALLLAHHSKIDTVQNILRDVDWSTLLFFMSIFVLIGGLQKTEVISSLSGTLSFIIGKNVFVGSLLLLFIVGLLSNLVPNIPLVVAMIPLLKQHLVTVGLAGSEILAHNYSGSFPPEVLPLFYAMMFGATLGGNGTLVGASANIVAAGIAEQHGQKISFKTFFKYGFPLMLIQLTVAAIYLIISFLL